jgi:dTDP-4-dehydrorhamnose reductase
MRILITGASGLLGINLALEYAAEHTVFGTVNTHGLDMNLLPASSRFNSSQVDLLAPGCLEAVVEQSQPDWVIHCAALANLEACEEDPALAMRLNAELPGRLAQLVRQLGARLVHISTDAVFDGLRGGYTEYDAPNPLSTYAKSKLAGEIAVQKADPSAFIARVNLFGWSLSGRRSLAEFFYYNLKAGKSVKGFTDVYFCPLLVNHLAAVLTKVLNLGLSGCYHLVSSECSSKYEFGIRLAKLFGLDESLIEPASFINGGLRAPRSPRLTLDTHKLSTAIGQALPGLSTGLEQFYQLYQQGYPQLLQTIGAAYGN